MPQPTRTEDAVIRKFRPADYERVMDLWEQGRLPLKPKGRDSLAQIKRQIRMPNLIFLVAEREGRVLGTVLATHDGRKGWINRLAVDAAWRGRGIGRRLVAEAERWLAGLGIEIFACLIEDWNTASMTVFEKLGYKKHPEIIYFAKRKYPDV